MKNKVRLEVSDNRIVRAFKMLDAGVCPKVDPQGFLVKSQKGGEVYLVFANKSKELECECYAFTRGYIPCKHIYLIALWNALCEIIGEKKLKGIVCDDADL